jgi:hypothetical protein
LDARIAGPIYITELEGSGSELRSTASPEMMKHAHSACVIVLDDFTSLSIRSQVGELGPKLSSCNNRKSILFSYVDNSAVGFSVEMNDVSHPRLPNVSEQLKKTSWEPDMSITLRGLSFARTVVIPFNVGVTKELTRGTVTEKTDPLPSFDRTDTEISSSFERRFTIERPIPKPLF